MCCRKHDSVKISVSCFWIVLLTELWLWMVNCEKSRLEIISSFSSKKDWWIPPQSDDVDMITRLARSISGVLPAAEEEKDSTCLFEGKTTTIWGRMPTLLGECHIRRLKCAVMTLSPLSLVIVCLLGAMGGWTGYNKLGRASSLGPALTHLDWLGRLFCSHVTV